MAKAKARLSVNEVKQAESLFDPEEIEILRGLAREKVREEQKAAERQRLADEYVAEERSKFIPDEAMVDIVIDLPGHSEALVIDSCRYSHGQIYRVTEKVAASMRDNMARAWFHEGVVKGVNQDRYRPPRNLGLSPNQDLSTTALKRMVMRV